MLNKIILMGRLIRDPELKYTANNTAVCSFALACNRDYVPQGGQTTDFINAVAWGKTAEFISKYFVKGQLMAITGRIQARTYTDKTGNNRVAVEINVEEAHFAEPKKKSSSDKPKSKLGPENDYNFTDDDFSEISDEDGTLPF